MSKKKTVKKNNKNSILVIVAVILAVAAILVVVVKKDQNNQSKSTEQDVESASVENENEQGAQVINPGEEFVIEKDEVTEQAMFYPVEVDGTEMEILAVKASDGSIRTAFNTCQVCYSSGRGYYEQDGDWLVCQNCGNSYTADDVEIAVGGCNPYPIFADNKTETEDSIQISYDFLKEATVIFENWKY